MITITDLFEAYEPGLRRYAEGLTRDADAAADLVSETFLRAMPHLTLLECLNLFQRRAWLYRTLKNRFIDLQRARKRERALCEQIAWEDSLYFPPVYNPDLLAGLPEKFRELLHMAYVLGMTSEEIGQKLSIPAATARSRLRLALQWLRAHPSKLNR
jgi:RNA polymerase sigma-70 factor (ECF subfamily)